MEPTAALLYGLVLCAIGAPIVYHAWSELQPVVHILQNDPIPIRDLPRHDGPVEIEGTAAIDEGTFASPFTHTDCLAYEYTAQEYRSSGQSGSWRTLDEGWGAVPFLVDDGTGTIRIDPTDATLEFDKYTIKVSGGEQPPPPVMQYLQGNPEMEPQHDETFDLGITELNTGNSQRFVEQRLDIGDSVHVYGAVEPTPGGSWGSDLVGATVSETADGTFAVSDSSERGTAWQLAKQPLLVAAVGLVFAVPGVVLLLNGLSGLVLGV